MSATTGVRVSARHTALVVYLFTVVMAGATLPTPLYAIYSADLALSPTTITVIYAVYAVGVLGALLLLGRLSDHIGRRPIIALAVGMSALSAVVFATTEDLSALYVGRLLSGLSAGLITGAATAYIAELEHARGEGSRAAVLATLANMGGLGIGPVLAGVLADHVAHPTVVPFVVDLVVLVPVVLIPFVGLPETVRARDGWRNGVRLQRVGVPAEIRVGFAAAAIAGLAAFALLGFTTALAGQLLSGAIGNHSHQTAGVVASLLFAGVVVAQVIAGRFRTKVANLVGLTLLPLGSLIIVAAVFVPSFALLVVGALVGGFGVGLAFRASLASVTALAPADRRAEVISTFFIVAYVGITIPVVAAGILITNTTLATATTALAIFVVALVAVAATIVARLPDPTGDAQQRDG